MFDTVGTKDKIYRESAKLFAKKNYYKVATRDIAKAAGVNTSTLAYYFGEDEFDLKEDVVKGNIRIGLFKAYRDARKNVFSNIDLFMEMAETKDPHKLLGKLEPFFVPKLDKTMEQILAIAIQGMTTDTICRCFIIDNVLATTQEVAIPIINKLVQMGRIEPVDTKLLNSILMCLCTGAVTLEHTNMKIERSELKKSFGQIFKHFIVPIDEAEGS